MADASQAPGSWRCSLTCRRSKLPIIEALPEPGEASGQFFELAQQLLSSQRSWR